MRFNLGFKGLNQVFHKGVAIITKQELML